MDWLMFKFCVFIWALCVSKSQSELKNSSNSDTSLISIELRTACMEGHPVASPDQCNSCICFDETIYCTHLSCVEQECEGHGEVAKPDPCNKCICRRGKVSCSDRICIPAPNCSENELFPAQNECNVCVCLNGYISCTTNPCDNEYIINKHHTAPLTISRPKKKKKCVEGTRIPGPNDCIVCICRDGRKKCKSICKRPKLESRFAVSGPECKSGEPIPRPDQCNHCICFERQIHCTHMPCPDTRHGLECTDDQPVYRPDECNECYCFDGKLECSDLVCIRGSKCVEGEVIPKPDSCNSCNCVEGHILCSDFQCSTLESRNVFSSEMTDGQGDQKKQTDLEVYDKQISMEPFITMLSKHHEKLPTKVIHTHAYNGYHQEIKVHSSNLPKDATQLLQVLATSLDNPALASISQRLSSSVNDSQEDQANVTSRDTLVAHSSKLITSGSRSNETILVVPKPELFDNPSSLSVLPLITKHETTWESVAAPVPLVSINGVTYQLDPQGKPAQFGNPGLSNPLPPKPTPIFGEIPNKNTPPFYQILKPTLISNNDGIMTYTTYPQETNTFKNFHHHRPTHGPNIFNFGSSRPLQKPGNFIATPNNNGGQKTSPQSQFIPNPSKLYSNQGKLQQFQPIPNQNVPTINNNGFLRPPLFKPKPNQSIVSANRFKPPKPLFGFKSDHGSIGPLNNKGNQSDQLFLSILPQNFQKNPPPINLPSRQKSIAFRGFDDNDEIPSSSQLESNSPNILTTPQNEENSDLTQPRPYSITTYTEHQALPSLLHKTNKSGNVPTHSHYTKHTTITYISKYDSPAQSDPSQVGHDLNQHYNAPYNNAYESYLPEMPNTDYGSLEPDQLTSKVDHYLNVRNIQLDQSKPNPILTKYHLTHHFLFPGRRPNNTLKAHSRYNQTEPWNKSNHHFDIFIDPYSDSSIGPINFYRNRTNLTTSVYPNKFADYLQNPYLALFNFPKKQHKKGGSNDYSSAEGLQFPSNSAEDPRTGFKHLPPQSISEPTQNQHTPGVFHNGGSTNKLKLSHNIYEDPRQLKPFKIETTPHHQLLVAYDEPVITNSLQYPSNSAEDLLHPQLDQHKSNFDSAHPIENLHDLLNSPFAPSQNQLNPGVLHNREVNDRHTIHKFPKFSFGPTLIRNTTGMFNESGSADAFQNKQNSTGIPLFTRGNQHNHPRTKLGPSKSQNLPGLLKSIQKSYPSSSGPSQNQYTPAQLGDNESADHFHLPSRLHSPSHFKSNLSQKQHLPGMFDDATSASGDLTLSKGKQTNSPFGLTPNQPTSHSPGVFDDRASADPLSDPYNSAENSKHPRDEPPKVLFAPNQNQHLLAIFDNSASPDGFHNPSDSAGDSTHLSGKSPNSPFSSIQNQPASHLPGILDNSALTDRFHNPSDPAGDSTHPRGTPPNSPFGSIQNQPASHLPGIFDNSASPDGSHNPTDSAGDFTPQSGKPPNSLFGSIQNQPASHLPGILDSSALTDRFHNPSDSAGDSTHPSGTPPNSPFGPTQHQPDSHLPGLFDNSAPPAGFHNPSDSAGDSAPPKGTKPNSPLGSPQNQTASHLPGIFDDLASPDGSNYPSNSAEDPKHPTYKPPYSPFDSPQTQPASRLPGIFDNSASPYGFQNPSNSTENPTTHFKGKPGYSQFNPSQNQNLPGVLDDSASNNGSYYPPNSAEILTHPKLSQHNPGLFKLGSNQSPLLPTVKIVDRSVSDEDLTDPKGKPPNFPLDVPPRTKTQNPSKVYGDGESNNSFHYPPNSAEIPTHPKLTQHNPGLFQFSSSQPTNQLDWTIEDRSDEDPVNSKGKPPNSPFGPTQNQDLAGGNDDPESVEGHISNSAKNPAILTNNRCVEFRNCVITETKFKKIQNQSKPSSLDVDIVSKENENQPKIISVLNPLKPLFLEHGQYKPFLFDSLFTSSSKPGIQFDHDQYKPFFDHLLNSLHDIPWSDSNSPNKTVVYYTEITTPPSRFQAIKDILKPSTNQDRLLSISNQNGNTDISDANPYQLQTEQDMSSPFTTLIKSYSTQDNPLLNVGGDLNNVIPNDGGTILIYNQFFPSHISAKKLNEPLIDKSESGAGGTDQLSVLPSLSPGFSNILNYEPSSEQDNGSTLENDKFEEPNILNGALNWIHGKLKKKYVPKSESGGGGTDQPNVLPSLSPDIYHILNYEPSSEQDNGSTLENDNFEEPNILNGALNWVQGKLKKYVPPKNNSTAAQNSPTINKKSKFFFLLSKLTPSAIQDNAKKLNIPHSSSHPKLIEKLAKEDDITTTQSPSTDATTHSLGHRFQSVPTVLEDKEQPAAQQKYSEVHIILHQSEEENDKDLATYLKTHAVRLFTDTGLEGSGPSSKSLFKHLPKDRKEECGDGTHWITNCHGCSCYFGKAMCFKMPDCELRPFGEPMTCKPYSHFKLGECYTCECSGDGVAECEATNCKTSTGTIESLLLMLTESFEDKKEDEKLPKGCSQISQTQLPTCEKGTSWISSCHKCDCDDSGHHTCVKVDNCKLDYDNYGKPSRCKPNSKFYPKSNSLPCVECTCNDEGTAFCPGSDFT